MYAIYQQISCEKLDFQVIFVYYILQLFLFCHVKLCYILSWIKPLEI